MTASSPHNAPPYSAVWSISHHAYRAPALARLWHSVTGPGSLCWVSA